MKNFRPLLLLFITLLLATARGQADNIVDTTFQPALTTDPDIVVPLTDGRLYIVSASENFAVAGHRQHGLARLRVDGSVDPTFDVGSGTDAGGTIKTLNVLSDGRVVLSGTFQTINGIARPLLARLLASGEVDQSFQPDAALLAPNPMLRYPLLDGRWIVNASPGDLGKLTFTRFTASGSVDTTYRSGSVDRFNHVVDGKLVSFFSSDFIEPTFDASGYKYFGVRFLGGNSIFQPDPIAYYRLNRNGDLEPDPVITLRAPSQSGQISSGDGLLEFDERRALYRSFSSAGGFEGGSSLSSFGVSDFLTNKNTSISGYGSTFNGGSVSVSYGYGPAVTLGPDGIYANAGGTRGRIGIVRFDFDGKFDPDFRCEISDPSFLLDGSHISVGSPNYRILANGQILMRATSVNGVPTRFLARLTPNRTAGTTRLSNISIRARTGSGAQTLIVGYVVANGAKNVLARGAGPALTQFGVTSALDDPQLSLFRGATIIDSNDDWSATTSDAAARVGAFAFSPGSRDAALLANNPAGAYTVQIAGKAGGTGVALAELYDTDARPANAAAPRVVNFSARTVAGTGGDTLIAGFSIDGDNTRTVLIRAIGPGLTQFGVSGVLADPVLTLYRNETPIATNDNWGDGTSDTPYWNDPAALLAEAFRTVGAFALDLRGKDAALLVTLAPGSYTTQVTGANGTTGVALLEVYEVP